PRRRGGGPGARGVPVRLRHRGRPAGRDRPHARPAGRRRAAPPRTAPPLRPSHPMNAHVMTRRLASTAVFLLTATLAAAQPAADPRVGLRPGWQDAGVAASNMELVGHAPKPEGFFNPDDVGDFSMMNSDMAFRGNTLFLGNFHGLQVYDISDPTNPTLRATLPCPGGQNDVSIYGDLLFMSVEETRGRLDCGAQGVAEPVSAERFRGVRIFDVSDVEHPRQVAAVQTCRGSHTHTLVPDPDDPSHVYVYV